MADHEPPSFTTTPEPDRRLLQAALTIAGAGLPVFPLQPRGTKPVRGLIDWSRQATDNLATVHRWWQIAPFNIGVATGSRIVSELRGGRAMPILVIELRPAADDRPHGRQALAELAQSHGQPLPATTFTVNDPTGGQQLYFRVSASAQLPNTDNYLGPGVDTRAHRGYVVGPGSRVPAGQYELVDDHPPALLPPWIDTWLRGRGSLPASIRQARTQLHVVPARPPEHGSGPFTSRGAPGTAQGAAPTSGGRPAPEVSR